MRFDKQEILDLLAQQERHDEWRRARQELPHQVDTEDPAHVELLADIGVAPREIVGQLAGGAFGL